METKNENACQKNENACQKSALDENMTWALGMLGACQNVRNVRGMGVVRGEAMRMFQMRKRRR